MAVVSACGQSYKGETSHPRVPLTRRYSGLDRPAPKYLMEVAVERPEEACLGERRVAWWPPYSQGGNWRPSELTGSQQHIYSPSHSDPDTTPGRAYIKTQGEWLYIWLFCLSTPSKNTDLSSRFAHATRLSMFMVLKIVIESHLKMLSRVDAPIFVSTVELD